MEKKRVLILCTGNSARSQMAEGLLRHDAGDRFEVESAGTKPRIVRPEAIAVLKEVGIDITAHRSKHVEEFDGHICADRRHRQESCPFFVGTAMRLHKSFKDPAVVEGPQKKRMAAFRNVRDEMRSYLKGFPQQ
jgi:arsenate reductase